MRCSVENMRTSLAVGFFFALASAQVEQDPGVQFYGQSPPVYPTRKFISAPLGL